MNLPIVDVAVCIVTSPDGRVLLAERTARQISAGFWELPGGKVEKGETTLQAAARELREETGLSPTGLAHWLSYDHQFPTRRLRLHFFRAQGYVGTPHGREGQRLAWVDPRAPHVGPILPSNDRALFGLTLPQTYVVADFSSQDRPEDYLARLHSELASGQRLIRVRVGAGSPGQVAALLARVAALAVGFRDARILAASATEARRAGLTGVHSDTGALRQMTSRPGIGLWAATCHTESDLSRAVSLGADFAVLTPVLADPDRPVQIPHGWDGLRRLAAASPVGIYAQGGLALAHMATALQAGAAGVVKEISSTGHVLRRHGQTQDVRQYGERLT